MRTIWMQRILSLIGLVTVAGAAAGAQTDVAVSVYGAFTTNPNQNANTPGGIEPTQSLSNAAGGLLEVRHIVHPWLGYEETYAFNRANQSYAQSSQVTCGVCSAVTSWTPVSANAHEVSGDWVASLNVGNLRPFALAGVGILFDVPSSGQATTFGLIREFLLLL